MVRRARAEIRVKVHLRCPQGKVVKSPAKVHLMYLQGRADSRRARAMIRATATKGKVMSKEIKAAMKEISRARAIKGTGRATAGTTVKEMQRASKRAQPLYFDTVIG